MTIRSATLEDKLLVTELALELWPDNTFSNLLLEFNALLLQQDVKIVLAIENTIPLGFAQGQLRHDYVEGTSTSPVGYLEGIYCKEGHRKQGIAQRLLRELENWAREQGCSEFASDTGVENTASIAFHLQSGFQEANRIVCFTKSLQGNKSEGHA